MTQQNKEMMKNRKSAIEPELLYWILAMLIFAGVVLIIAYYVTGGFSKTPASLDTVFA